MTDTGPPRRDEFLQRSGLTHARRWTPLAGGVSSDIWRVDLDDGRALCVKRALPKLKAAANLKAPVSRNACEWAWMEFVAQVLPNVVPKPLAHDEAAGLFAMQYLDPADHPVWKHQLVGGSVDIDVAQSVGRIIGTLHAKTAYRDDLAREFDTGETFHALRFDPYLHATGERHPSLASRFAELAKRTASTRISLVHGDLSPENILVGPHGPVLLDAECAWYGDPAFDVAFCLNHLLLQALPRPDCIRELGLSFEAFVEAYFAVATFERRAALEARAATLLPALLLACVDGKFPVEDASDDVSRERVREAAIPLLQEPVDRLARVAECAYSRLMR